MEHIQITNFTPTDFENIIFEGIKRHVNELRNSSEAAAVTELMTRNEVAALFKINLSTLHSWTKDEKLISYGIGGRVYYKRSEVVEAIVKLNH